MKTIPIPRTLDGNKYQADDKRVKFRREGDDVLFLAIDKASTEDTGHYHVTCSNVEGQAETEGDVQVNSTFFILFFVLNYHALINSQIVSLTDY